MESENPQVLVKEAPLFSLEGETPQKIIELAFIAFREKGFHNVALDEISKELHISKKTIYKYFKSKEDVLSVCFDVQLHKAEAELQKINTEKSGGVESFAELSKFYRTFSATFEPFLIDPALEEFSHLKEKYNVFESLSLKKSFSKLLKNLRSAKMVAYPSPTRDLVSAWLDAVRGMKVTGNEQMEYICRTFYKGISLKSKKKK